MPLPAWALPDKDGKFSERRGAVSGGIVYNLIATIFQIIGSLVSVLIFARLLTAEDFGVFGQMAPFIGILVMMADGGTVYYTMRRTEIEDRALSFTFWYTTVIGLGLIALMALASPAIAWVMGEERLLPVGLVMSLVLFFSAAGCQHMALAMRCFRNDIRTWSIAISTLGGLGLGVLVAWLGGGYWALVAAQLGRIAIQAIALYFMTGWVPLKPRWDREEFRAIISLSNAELLSRIALNTVREGDRIAVGILFATTVTGYYSVAYMLSITPLVQLTTPLFFVVVPYLTEMRDRPERFFDVVRLLIRSLVFVLVPGAIYVGIFAEEIIGTVLGADKLASAEVFPVLILTAVMTVLIGFVSVPFQSVDRPDLTRRYNFWMFGTLAVALAIAIPIGTPLAIAWGMFGSNLASLIFRFHVMTRFFGKSPMAEALRLAPVLVLVLALPLAVAWPVERLLAAHADWPGVAQVAVIVGAFVATWGLVGWTAFGPALRGMLRRDRAGTHVAQQEGPAE